MENLKPDKKKYIFFVLIWILFFVVFYPAIKGLLIRWDEDANFSHGFLIPFVVIYLIWEKRNELDLNFEETNPWALTTLIFGLLLYVFGIIGQAQFFASIAFYISIVGLVFYLCGTAPGKKLIFPLTYIAFMIPLPYSIYDRITIPLKLFATKISTLLISMIGIPFRLDGAIIHLPNASLEVADACSGLRSLISLMALGAIFAYYSQKSPIKRTVLFLSSIPIAILGNIIRIALTAWIAFVYGEKIATSFLHEFSGIVIFIFGLIFLYAVGELLNWQKNS